MDKKKVINISKEVLNRVGYFNNSDPSVDLDIICMQHNILVINSDINTDFSVFQSTNINYDNLNAFILYNYKDYEAVIVLNKTRNQNRKRFLLAHMLGHFFLKHINGENRIIIDTLSKSCDLKEKEANLFAVYLLMPTVSIRNTHKEMLFPMIILLAERFNVSCTAMKYHLTNLGLEYY